MSSLYDLPDEPSPGQPLKAEWGVKLLRALRKMRWVDSPTIKVSVTTKGTSGRVIGGGAGGGAAASICLLGLTDERPAGYPEPEEGADLGWVTWGHVNSVVPDNVAEPFTLSTNLLVWIKVATNGAVPLRVLSAEIGTGAELPEDIGGTATTPPTTAHYLLGQVLGDGEEVPFYIANAGCGNLVLSTVAMGYSCQLASAGDPEADPPVPASAGGVKTDYQLRWDRV